MKKTFAIMLCVTLAGLLAPPACAALLDSYVDTDYNFAHMKRLYVWPAECDNIPENVRYSLPGLIVEWTGNVFADKKRLKFNPFVKSTERMWEDIQFIKGRFDLGDPFESACATAKFQSLLGEACEGTLKISVSVTQVRYWQEPTTEEYWEWEKVTIKNKKGELEEVDVHVMKERVFPGRWLVDTRAECRADLYDVRSGSEKGEKLIAAKWVEALDTRDDGKSVQAAEKAAQNALRAALGGIFYK